MVETRESCLQKRKNFNTRTKRCIETEESCKARGKVYNVTTKRCNSKKNPRSKTKSRSKPRSNTPSKSKSPSPETCPICLEPLDFKSRKNLFSGINCDHFFHKNCIQSWCKSKFDCKCPICRQLLFHRPVAGQTRQNSNTTRAIHQYNPNDNITTIGNSPDGLPPGVTERSTARLINNATRRASPDGPPPGVSATHDSLARNQTRIISIYNEMQSLNPNDPRRNQLGRSLHDAGVEQVRLYRQDANERGIPRETYINSILPNRG